MPKKPKTIIVFGVFDIIHDGHRHFLKRARKLGDCLVAAVASDLAVKKLKGLRPSRPFEERVKNLRSEGLADEILSGDDELGSWKIFSRRLPDIIALGYDQTALGEALAKFIAKNELPIKRVTISPHTDKSLHSSALRNKI